MIKYFYKKLSIFIYLLVLLVINLESQGTILHLKPGPVDGKDAYLSSDAPNTVFNNHPEFSGDAWTCNGNPCFGRGLLQFDLSSIPNGALIISASVSFYANPAPINGGGISMQGNNQAILQRVITSWDESFVTWNIAPMTTSQNQIILNQSSSQFQDYLNIDVRPLIQDMVNDPANSFGFLLRLSSENFYSSMIFASSDYSDPNLWPEITIEYSDSTQFACIELLLENGQGADVYLSSFDPLINFGNHEELSGDAWTCNLNPCFGRGLFSFDLSTIPVNSQITSAKLDLYANPNPSNGNGISMQGSNSIWLQRVITNWSENITTWNTAPNTSTQNEVTLAQSSTSFQDYLNIDVRDLVIDMVDNPSSSFGFMIRLVDEVPYTTMIFASSDYPDTALHPKLTICYSNLIGIDKIDNIIGFADVFPNPINEKIDVKFNLKGSSKVKIELFDVLGRVVYSVDKGVLNSGIHIFQIATTINDLKRGVYFLRLNANRQMVMKKLIKN